jgi:hypothetical protein
VIQHLLRVRGPALNSQQQQQQKKVKGNMQKKLDVGGKWGKYKAYTQKLYRKYTLPTKTVLRRNFQKYHLSNGKSNFKKVYL